MTTLGACGGDEPTDSSIAAPASATAELSTLVAAVDFASDNGGLMNLIAEPGTLTVFAPTNAAFARRC